MDEFDYSILDKLEMVSGLVTVNVRHIFTAEERAEESLLLAQAVNDRTHEENNKKVQMAEVNNKIKQLEAKIKVHAGHVDNGFMNMDKPAEMYRDYERRKRIYIDKNTRLFLKEEDFHASDFQKKIEFDEEFEQGINQAKQIKENNEVGEFANTDQLDNVINDKVAGKEFTDDELPSVKEDLFKKQE